MTRDDVEPTPRGRGLWVGEVTGLRLGEVPAGGQRSGRENRLKHERYLKNVRHLIRLCYGSSLTCTSGPCVVGEGDRRRPLLGNSEQVWIGSVRQTWAGDQNTHI